MLYPFELRARVQIRQTPQVDYKGNAPRREVHEHVKKRYLSVQIDHAAGIHVGGQVKKVVQTNESTCKGCGCCQATCPKNGVLIRGFTLDQIRAQIEAALEVA